MAELEVPATLAELSSIGAFVRTAAEQAGLDRQAAYRLRLAVDELATNVIVHGKPGEHSGDDRIRFTSQMDDQSLTIIMEDRGPAFDPLEHRGVDEHLHKPMDERPIGGLGVFLAVRGVDQFQYQRVEDRNRSIFTTKRPARAEVAP